MDVHAKINRPDGGLPVLVLSVSGYVKVGDVKEVRPLTGAPEWCRMRNDAPLQSKCVGSTAAHPFD